MTAARGAAEASASPARVTELFQKISYLQYPAMLAALAYAVKPAFTGLAGIFDDANYALLYMGIGIGLSSLQDPKRTQNEVSRKVWQDPRKGFLFLCLIAGQAFLMMVAGLVGSYVAGDSALNQLSLGLFSLGLGMLGMLKTAIDMYEHHRLDKNATDACHPVQETNA
jgi:hypothetical protein